MTSDAQNPSTGKADACRPFIGLVPLMREAFAGGDLKPLGAQLVDYATQHPHDAHALMDLSTVLQLTGHRELALATQLEALQMQQIYHLPASGEVKLRLLALKSAGDLMANTPLEFLLENSDVALDMLYVGGKIPPAAELPEHDLMFVAIGESDENDILLEALSDVIRSWPHPVLNSPERIPLLARNRACELLNGIDGVLMPPSTRISRQDLKNIGAGEISVGTLLDGRDFPIIARPVGSHAGQGLKRLNSPGAVPDYLQAVPSKEFYIAPFIDYRSGDGQYRKYRIMLIRGRPFICHMAISSHWMIHYLNAGMAESAEKRAEEERFMAGFDQEFVPRHQTAFQSIADRIGLDYLGLDCGETPDGKLLIFEADSDMIVHDMDPVDLFPYKKPQMHKLFAAFKEMLAETAAGKQVDGPKP